MRKYLAILLVLVMLLSACGTHQTSSGDPADATENTVLDDQNGTTDNTNISTDATGDSSGTGTTDDTTESTNSTQGSTDETTKPPQDSTVPEDYILKISRSTLELEVGEIGNLTAEYTGTGTLTWESSDTSKATVSNGKVTAKAAGTVVITVKDGTKKSQCMVTITKPTTETQPPKEVTLKLNKSSLSLKVGESSTLSATYDGNKSLTWNSTNSSIASVSNGKVTAKSAGTVTIEVTDGVKKAQCVVTVAPKEVKLRLNSTSLNLVVGNTSTLTYEYTGTGKLSWSSSNAAVATVSNGTVTAKAAGTAYITLSDGTRNAQCMVTVTAPATASKTFTFNTTNNTTITVGSTFQIDYSYSGSNSELTWSSTDSSVLTVNNSGVVTAKAKGAATVKVTNGEKIWRLSIRVEEAKPLVTSFYYSNQNAPLYDGVTKYAGDYMTFYVSTRPYESNRNINITSSNNSVVSVSCEMVTDGKIAAVTLNFKSAGTATVKIASADGAYSESYTITVKSDYDCNPGDGQLTPEQYVKAYNGIVKAFGMNTSYTPSGYLVATFSASDLTWARARREAEGAAHHWYSVGVTYLVLTYEGTNENGQHIFYEHR